MTICVTSGFIAVGDGGINRVITPKDGPVRLTKKQEARFVGLGVARYVDVEAPATPSEPVGTPADEPVEKPIADEVEKSDEASDYGSMSLADLKALCKDRGIEMPKKPTVEALAQLLEDDDTPPAIGAKGVGE